MGFRAVYFRVVFACRFGLILVLCVCRLLFSYRFVVVIFYDVWVIVVSPVCGLVCACVVCLCLVVLGVCFPGL